MNNELLEAGFSMPRPERHRTTRKLQSIARIAGLLMAAPIVLWFFLGLLGVTPSIVQVFGSAEVRTPAAVVVAGLLIAAMGFWDE
jgi:hypothetical protein